MKIQNPEGKSRKGKIAAFIKDVNKRFEGRAVIQTGRDIAFLSARRIRTGSLGLDIAMNGGVPMGMVTEMFGEESSGKTTMCMKIIGTLQAALGDKASVLWIAAEPFDKKWANQCGATVPFSDADLKILTPGDRKWAKTIKDVGSIAVMQAKDGESSLQAVLEGIRGHLFHLIVVDSVAALIPSDVEEKDMDAKSYAPLPKLMSQFCGKCGSAFNARGEHGEANDTAVILINQVRDQIGGYGHPEPYSPGGRAMRHAAACRVRFKRGEIFKEGSNDNKYTYARRAKIKVEKNKVGPPFREAEFDFYFGDFGEFQAGDIDVYQETRYWGVKEGIIEQVGQKTYTYGGKNFNGKAAVETFLYENEKALADIQLQILARTCTVREDV